MNIKTIYILIATISLLSFFTSCNKDSLCETGNKKVERKEIFLEEIQSITLKGSGTLYITYGETQKIEVETNKDLFDRINQDVNNGHWDATFKGCVRKFGKLKFYVTIPRIEALKVEGSGDIDGNENFEADNLKLEVKGSGKITLNTSAQNLTSKITGSGDIILEGNCINHEIDINGSGALRAYNLKSQTTQVEINGSGDALISVDQKLYATIEGSGKVTYKGSPVKETTISGSGSVKAY